MGRSEPGAMGRASQRRVVLNARGHSAALRCVPIKLSLSSSLSRPLPLSFPPSLVPSLFPSRPRRGRVLPASRPPAPGADGLPRQTGSLPQPSPAPPRGGAAWRRAMPPRREDHAPGTVRGASYTHARTHTHTHAHTATQGTRGSHEFTVASAWLPARRGLPAAPTPPSGGRGPGQHRHGRPAQFIASASGALARAQAPEQRPGGPAAPRRGPRMVRSPRPGQGACLEATATIPARVPPGAGGTALDSAPPRRAASGARRAAGRAAGRHGGTRRHRHGPGRRHRGGPGRVLDGFGTRKHQTPGARRSRTARTGAGSGPRRPTRAPTSMDNRQTTELIFWPV